MREEEERKREREREIETERRTDREIVKESARKWGNSLLFLTLYTVVFLCCKFQSVSEIVGVSFLCRPIDRFPSLILDREYDFAWMLHRNSCHFFNIETRMTRTMTQHTPYSNY